MMETSFSLLSRSTAAPKIGNRTQFRHWNNVKAAACVPQSGWRALKAPQALR